MYAYSNIVLLCFPNPPVSPIPLHPSPHPLSPCVSPTSPQYNDMKQVIYFLYKTELTILCP